MEILDTRARHRELLARLDRIATVRRGHRAGLHLEDRDVLDEYSRVLAAYENQLRLPADADEAGHALANGLAAASPIKR